MDVKNAKLEEDTSTSPTFEKMFELLPYDKRNNLLMALVDKHASLPCPKDNQGIPSTFLSQCKQAYTYMEDFKLPNVIRELAQTAGNPETVHLYKSQSLFQDLMVCSFQKLKCTTPNGMRYNTVSGQSMMQFAQSLKYVY